MNNVEPSPDEMNIDDFIEPNSTASPANPTPSPPTPPSHSTTSAIPIKHRRAHQEQDLHANFPPSAPSNPRPQNREFDYVQRRVRKTSIDETRVRPFTCTLICLGTDISFTSHANGQQNSHRRFTLRLLPAS